MSDVERDFSPWELADERACEFCHGSGYQSVEIGSSLTYRCPDCDERREEE